MYLVISILILSDLVMAGDELIDYYQYCSVKCKAPYVHVLCARRKVQCDIGDKCKNHKFPMGDAERQNILDLFNKQRNDVASGNISPLPKAMDMNVLNWDYEMEYIAQCHVNRCMYNYYLDRPECITTRDNKPIAYTKSFVQGADFIDHIKLHAGNLSTLKQEDIDDYKQVTDFPIMSLWSSVTHMGCGAIIFGKDCQYTMCLFKGLFIGDKIYHEGEPCSHCRNCNSQFTSLCGILYPILDLNKEFWMTTTSGSEYSKINLWRNDVSDGTSCIHTAQKAVKQNYGNSAQCVSRISSKIVIILALKHIFIYK